MINNEFENKMIWIMLFFNGSLLDDAGTQNGERKYIWEQIFQQQQDNTLISVEEGTMFSGSQK
jgi:uncharacterized Fe-S cluster-containing MiaB family protein